MSWRDLNYLLKSIFLLILLRSIQCWSFFGEDSSSAKKPMALDAKGEAGRFELKASDDKFLAQAQTYMELSPLDQCNYRVINHLKRSCSDMCEEELNKMAVHLLNCQLATENRPTFECEEHMSIGECTSKMDATEWNGYQIVANRARAVCYTTRQQIFRIKTEAAVNKLVRTSHEQISGMEKLREDQQMLGKITEDTLHKVDATQHEMLLRHEKMKSSQIEMEQHIVKNLKSLTREKALIAAGQKEIADMTEDLKAQLDHTAKAMEKQGEIQGDTHEEILRDLAQIREQAHEVMSKMTGNAETMAAYQSMTHSHYEETLNSLRQVNASVNFVISTVNALQDGVYSKLGWLEVALGGTGDKVAFLQTVCSHILYLILAALSAVFLRTPPFTRLFLLIIIPLNAVAEIRGKSSLDFALMTFFILVSATANVTLNVALGLFSNSYSSKAADDGGGSSSAESTEAASALTPLSELVSEHPTRRKLRKLTSSRRRGSRSRSRSRSRSVSRSRVRRISSSSSSSAEETIDPEATVDPTFVPSEEDSLEDSRPPSRLSSTLISNSAHLAAKFGANELVAAKGKSTSDDVPTLGTLAPKTFPNNGIPDRSYSESALSSLRLLPHGSIKPEAKASSSRLPTENAFSSKSTPSPPVSTRPILTEVTLNVSHRLTNAGVSVDGKRDVTAFGNLRLGSDETNVKLTNKAAFRQPLANKRGGSQSPVAGLPEEPQLRRSRRRSSSRGRTVQDAQSVESQIDKENKQNQTADQSLRSQSLLTQHFGEDRASRRSKTPPRIHSATFDATKSPSRGNTSPRGKTPPRGIIVARGACSALTKTGTLCRNYAIPGQRICSLHLKSP